MNLYKSLLKNTTILTIGTICTRCVSFLMIPFFSRWLSAEDYGTFDLFCICLAIVVPLLSFSFGEGLFRKLVDADDENIKRYTSLSLLIFVFASILLCFISIIVFLFFDQNLLVPFLMMALGELFSYFSTNYARGKRKIVHFAISSFLFVCFISIFVTLFVFYLELELPGILYGYALAFYIQILYLFFTTKMYKDINFLLVDKKSFKDLMSYSLPLVPNNISWNLVNVIGRSLILFYLGAFSNGVYAIATKIPTICTALFSAFHLSWQESAIDALKEKEVFYNRVYNKSVVVVISICIVILSFNHILFNYVFDIKYHEAVFYSPILIAAMFFSFLCQFISGIFNAFEKTKINGVSTFYATTLNVVLCVLLIRWLNLYAIAVATMISYLFLFVYRIIKVKQFVVLKIESNLNFMILLYVAYSAIQYIDYMPLHLCSLFLAVIVFCVVNVSLIKRLKKM